RRFTFAGLALARLARETNRAITMTDEITSELTYQIVALEEIIAAPWWRRWRVRARLRADLRASVAETIHGEDFTERRLETLATGWITRPATRGSRASPYPVPASCAPSRTRGGAFQLPSPAITTAAESCCRIFTMSPASYTFASPNWTAGPPRAAPAGTTCSPPRNCTSSGPDSP